MMKSLQNPARAATLLLLALACSAGPEYDREVNMSFHFERNQLVLDGLRISGHQGRFVAGTSYPSTLIGSAFATRNNLPLTRPFRLTLRDIHNEEVAANVADLGGEMDAIIGFDVLAPVIVIDYQNRLLTRFESSPSWDPGLTHRWRDLPRYPLTIDGREVVGIINTAVPDTLLVPATMLQGRQCTRCEVDVVVGGKEFRDLTVQAADVAEIMIGNRMLEHFLVMIDYRRRTATLEQR